MELLRVSLVTNPPTESSTSNGIVEVVLESGALDANNDVESEKEILCPSNSEERELTRIKALYRHWSDGFKIELSAKLLLTPSTKPKKILQPVPDPTTLTPIQTNAPPKNPRTSNQKIGLKELINEGLLTPNCKLCFQQSSTKRHYVNVINGKMTYENEEFSHFRPLAMRIFGFATGTWRKVFVVGESNGVESLTSIKTLRDEYLVRHQPKTPIPSKKQSEATSSTKRKKVTTTEVEPQQRKKKKNDINHAYKKVSIVNLCSMGLLADGDQIYLADNNNNQHFATITSGKFISYTNSAGKTMKFESSNSFKSTVAKSNGGSWKCTFLVNPDGSSTSFESLRQQYLASMFGK